MNALIRRGCFALMLVGVGAFGKSNLPFCDLYEDINDTRKAVMPNAGVIFIDAMIIHK
jgi:hypothetical protein